MIENIPLVIGSQSSGEAYSVNLAAQHNIFISHSLDGQLPGIFISFIEQLLRQGNDITVALSLSQRMAAQVKTFVPAELLFLEFLHGDHVDGKINSIDEFTKELMKELKKRTAFYNRRGASLTMPPMLIFMDDIFEVIMSPNKKTALVFIELLATAVTVDMFFIMGSSGIYRNLLEQLINVTPALKKKLNKQLGEQNISQPLGAEMVMNPDGLIFFREKGEKVYRRLFPLVQNI